MLSQYIYGICCTAWHLTLVSDGTEQIMIKATVYYKYFLLSLMMVTLFYAETSYPDILDGGEIQFNGFVTNNAPKWTWQIGVPEQTWSVDTADARAENGKLIFDLREKGAFPFLEGHLHEVAERGGAGFTPFITFSSNGQPFAVMDSMTTTAQCFRASVPVRDLESGNVVGQLSFILNQGMAVSAGRQEEGTLIPVGMSLVSGQSVTEVQSNSLPQNLKDRLSSLLLMNQNFGDGMNAVDNGQVINQGVLADGRVMNLAASYASTVSDFELSLLAESTPAAWQAGLNVTVTVQ